jgi:hypothetical protein
MSVKEELLDATLARVLFNYDSNGYLVWNNPVNKTKKKGQRVGGRRKIDGRQQVMLSLKGKSYCFLIYRIVWLLHNGKWPSKTIDHIDGDCTNDRIENLRDITQQDNNENRYIAASVSQTGILGVCPHKPSGKIRATISKDGKQQHLGLFTSVDQAEAAYLAKKKELHIEQVR